jgi:glyoxylase-like metal-dependent hydrolase (beta-lactamase superfamily II)
MILEQIQTKPIGTNCYICGDEKAGEAFVIDPGNDADVVLGFVEEHGLRVTRIIATHAHWDHVGAVKPVREATGAPFLAPEGDLGILRQAAAQALARLDLRIEQPPDPDAFVVDGDVLRAGALTLTVRAAPGHSPGHVMLIGEGLAFVGDVIFAGSIGRTDIPGADGPRLLRTIKELVMGLPDATFLYPGHGPITTVGRERVSNPFLRMA